MQPGSQLSNAAEKVETYPLKDLQQAFLMESKPQEVRTPKNQAHNSFAILAISGEKLNPQAAYE